MSSLPVSYFAKKEETLLYKFIFIVLVFSIFGCASVHNPKINEEERIRTEYYQKLYNLAQQQNEVVSILIANDFSSIKNKVIDAFKLAGYNIIFCNDSDTKLMVFAKGDSFTPSVNNNEEIASCQIILVYETTAQGHTRLILARGIDNKVTNREVKKDLALIREILNSPW